VASSRKEALLRAIAEEEGNLERLESGITQARARLGTLRGELASMCGEPGSQVRLSVGQAVAEPRTPTEKVKLVGSDCGT
jgi:hypothetical protein